MPNAKTIKVFGVDFELYGVCPQYLESLKVFFTEPEAHAYGKKAVQKESWRFKDYRITNLELQVPDQETIKKAFGIS